MCPRSASAVLVVEDARQLADAIADGLRGSGHGVDVVFDGQAALESLAINDYDVVVLDRTAARPRGRGVPVTSR